MKCAHIFFAAGLLAAALTQSLPAADGTLPLGKDGQPLNLDFETGTLADWVAEGAAFEKQPVRGDTVAPRRSNMKSGHAGNFWIGTYEIAGDAPQGTLTSAPFKVAKPFASFLVAGGSQESTRVELVRADTQKAFFKISGNNDETLRPVVVDLREQLGKEIFIRLVDQESGGWGHINFDDFKFHGTRPQFANEYSVAEARKNEPPPADVVLYAGLSPQEACDKATLPPGFKMHVFAGEPDIKQPIAFCLDHRGRVWVAEGYTYPRRHGNPPKVERGAGEDRSKPTRDQLADIFGGADRILVFEDTDGDGKFDKRTVFLENLNLVSGLEVGFGGVWIGAAPYLMFVPITDGDAPKPAGDPQILLDGWNYTADTHETLNTFTWGPDGWLYGCHGVFCPSLVGKPGAPSGERQWCDAGVWRFHPTRRAFEIFTEGGSNPWGVDFDEYGQCWAEMCVIPHLWHMIQGARIERQGGEHFAIHADELARYGKSSGKPVHPHIYDDLKQYGDHVHWSGNLGPHAGNARSDAAGGGHAHAGMMCYLGASWPAEYRGNLIMGNIHGQRLNLDIPERSGSGFIGHHGKDFLNFNDTWSQTLNQLYDQDGSVYVIDWYDKNQCHHTREDGHDRSNGRIYKIVYNDQPMTRVDLAKLSEAELVKLVPSKNEFLSRHSRRVLQERAKERGLEAASTDALRKMVREASDSPARLRALWALHTTGGVDARTAIENLKSSDEWLRAWTIQLAFESEANLRRLMQEASDAGLHADPDLNQLAETDPSPVIRLFIAAAAQRTPTEEFRAGLVRRLLTRSEDASDHNVPLMIWFAMEPLVADHPEESLTVALDTKLPRILNFTARRIAALGTTEARDLLTAKLTALDDATKQIDVLLGFSAALRGQRNVPMPQGWDALETKLAASPNADVRAAAESLALTFGSQRALASLRATVADPAAPTASRDAALNSLREAKDPELPNLVFRLLDDPAMRGAALRAIAGFNDPRTPDAILKIYGSLDDGQKRDALNTLVSRAAFAKPLLAAVQSSAVPKSDLTAEVVRQLRNLKDAAVVEQVGKVYGAVREATAEKKQVIEKFKRTYWAGGSTPGEASRGRVVFNKVCAQCHTLFDTGGKVGPDLTGSSRADLDYILENMVDPNAVLPNEYRASNLELKDGRSLTGIIKQQDDKTLTVATANETLTLARGDVDSITQSQLSMMPEGLLDPLQDQELRDLIYYLGRPGQAALPAGAIDPAAFFNGKDLTGWDGDRQLWHVENGEIVGKTATGLKHNEFLKSQIVLTDFRLICQVKLTPNSANSGIQFRSEPFGEYEMKGCQADIGEGWWGKLYEESGRALLSKIPGDGFVKTNDWNTYEIVAVGGKIRTALNGHLCTDVDDPQVAMCGITGLQVHAGGPTEVRFKDLQLELNPKFEVKTMERQPK